jgi:hypothetical protein
MHQRSLGAQLGLILLKQLEHLELANSKLLELSIGFHFSQSRIRQEKRLGYRPYSGGKLPHEAGSQ